MNNMCDDLELKKNTKRKRNFLLISLICLILIACFDLYSNFVNNIMAVFLLIISFYNILKSKNNILSFMLHFQLFYYNYSVIFSRYLHVVNQFTEFYNNTDTRILGIGMLLLCIFEVFITYFCTSESVFKKENLYSDKPNKLISCALAVLMIYIFIFCFNWSNFGARGATSTIYEYSGILAILGLYYLGKNNVKMRILYFVLMSAFIIQGFVYGERVASLQMLFIIFFFFFSDKFKTKSIFIFGILGVMLMSFVGSYRSSYSLNNLNFSSIINSLFNRLLTFDGADLGYYCSLTFIMVANKVEKVVKFDLFKKFFLSIFIGGSDASSLQFFTRKYYSHWNGGFFPLAFYFYGGVPLVIASSYIWCKTLGKAISGCVKKYSNLFTLVGVYLVSICSRWYMYSPLNAFRPLLLFIIGFVGCEFINRLRNSDKSE